MIDEITFTGDRRGQAVVLVFAALGGALGVWWLLFDQRLLLGALLAIAAIGMAAFALPVVISPKSTYLRLDAKGFEVSSRRDKARVRWDEVAGFRSGEYNDQPVIEIEYVEAGKEPVLRRIFDRYNASLSDILSQLVGWRTRFGSHTSSTP